MFYADDIFQILHLIDVPVVSKKPVDMILNANMIWQKYTSKSTSKNPFTKRDNSAKTQHCNKVYQRNMTILAQNISPVLADN